MLKKILVVSKLITSNALDTKIGEVEKKILDAGGQLLTLL